MFLSLDTRKISAKFIGLFTWENGFMDKNNEKYRELKEKIFNTYGTEADTNRKMNVIAETLHAGITNYFWVGVSITI